MLKVGRTAVPRPANEPAAVPFPFAVPVKGLFLSENIAQSVPGMALALDNFIPESNKLRARKGSIQRNTGLPAGGVKTLLAWNGGTGSGRLFAASGTGIYDVSTAGAVAAPVVTGLTSVRLQSAVLTTAGGWFLCVVNGANAYRVFDGSAWSTPSVTGFTASNASNLFIHSNRLFFIEKGKLRAWYLPVDSIAGAANAFDFSASTQLGGFLVAGVSTSLSSGDGVATYCAVITSEGEIVIYRGINPAAAGEWTFVGTYRTGKPLGENCFQKVSGDVLVMTEDGIASLTQIMQLDRAAVVENAVTKPIAPLWRQMVLSIGSQPGWSMTLWSREGVMIVTPPYDPARGPIQYVVSLGQGSWGRFFGWNAECFAVFGSELVGGFSDTTTRRCDIGAQDNGQPYYARVMPSYSDAGSGFGRKFAKAIRVNVRATVNVRDAIRIRSDLEMSEAGPAYYGEPYGSINPKWNSVQWNNFNWGPSGQKPRANWVPCHGVGSYFSPDISFMLDDTGDADLELNAIDMIVVPGGLMA